MSARTHWTLDMEIGMLGGCRSLILLCTIASGCVSSGISMPEGFFSDVTFDSISRTDVPDEVFNALTEDSPDAEVESCERSRGPDTTIIYRLTLVSGSVHFFSHEGKHLAAR